MRSLVGKFSLRRDLRLVTILAALALSSTVLVRLASAMPINGAVWAPRQKSAALEKVRWVCGPLRCWWTPGPYWGGPYGYWRAPYACVGYYGGACYYGYRW